jgi:hypothetical protein
MPDLLSDIPTGITIRDEIRCAERELAQRRKVYPRLVYLGKMTQGAADREVAVMNAILNRLRTIGA